MKYTYLLVLLVVLAAACRKTERFYDQLDSLPRANELGNTSYVVGDTLLLTGKFGAGKANLRITIGGIEAPVISLTTHDSSYVENEVLYNYTLDDVKVLITATMIGQQQAVSVTVNGVGSTVATILVSNERSLPARSDTLTYLDPAQAAIALQMPAGTRVVPNYTPGAAIVFVNGDSLVTWQEGTIRRGKVTWTDSYGPFTVLNPGSKEYGFASDPSGDNLYVSCLTKDDLLPGTEYAATRLIKISLRDYSLTTLNRTAIPAYTSFIDESYMDLDTVRKEGNIAQVFLPVMKYIYVNSKAELFFSGPALNWNATNPANASSAIRSNLAVSRLGASGNFQYLIKGATSTNKIFLVRVRKGGRILSTYDFLPNLSNIFNYNTLLGIDAENGLMYGYEGTTSSPYILSAFYCYNLSQQRPAGEFIYRKAEVPTISDGPFDVVDGNYLPSRDFIYQWLSPGLPMVIFAMQQKDEADGPRSVKMINFATRSVSTYAPYIQAYDDDSKYRLGIGGNVIGYTASKEPLMVRTPEIDATIDDVLLMAPVQ